MENGYIKLFRKTLNKGYYKDSEYAHLWIHLLLKANHKETELLWNNEKLIVKRGQFITSRNTLVKETGINRSKIERVLKFLKTEQQIEQQNLYTSRLITIINYDKYQSSEQENEQQVSSKRAASEQQVSTNNKDKKDKNEKNDKNKNKSIVEQIITHLNEKAKTNYSPKTQITVEYINGRITEGFKLEDFFHVIDVKCNDWKGDSEQERFLRPETLFCKKKFEGYLNQKKEQEKESWAERRSKKESRADWSDRINREAKKEGKNNG